ncbi:zinc metalloproteinase-disintegrin-like crotastatin [Pseudophryne corroboree]|uniref:zinc metalloproteinase-disintegrin-like crotastatin n=1 Tax=Pseudophryne corroboree TaxID=495146 RepID=UPI00308205BF
MLQAALLLLALLDCQVLAFGRIPEGQKYEVVFPAKVHFLHKRDTQSTYPDLVQYSVHVEGNPLLLHLEKTENLISDDFTITLYKKDGTLEMTRPKDQDHCCYQGHVKQHRDSSLSICTCKGLSGLIRIRNRRFLIEPLNATDTGEHAVFDAKEELPKTCGVTNTTWMDGKTSKSSRSGNNAEKNAFLKSLKFVQLYMVVDQTIFLKYNRSTEAIKERLAEMINYVNEVYKPIATFVALIGIAIWEKDQFQVSSSANVNLDRFSNWRKDKLLPKIPNDNAQFLTNTDFDGPTVGLAFVGTMCSDSHSSAVIQDHSRLSIAVGATIAHEMGHNLGMNHDTNACNCPANSCIMAPTLSYNTPRLFSSCSLSNFQEFIFDRMPECMKDEPSKQLILSPSVCGNKFTEVGEDCDCGTVQECTNPCCDASTCKFKANVQCADGECCEKCKIKKAGAVCRPAKDDCDLADMCNGNSPVCTADRFIYNGHPCNDGRGTCYNGKCPMLQSQCVDLWGASAVVAEDSCFTINKRGTNYGYCQLLEGSYIPCEASNVRCGVLYCYGGSDNPSVYASVASFSKCRGVMAAAGMVQNGTMCEDGKVCYNGKCADIDSTFQSADCSANCPGHGICDHELQCQCQEGWAPPGCDATSGTNFAIIAVVIVIALALIVGLILMFVFRKKKMFCKRGTPATVSGATNPAYLEQAQKKSNISTPEQTSRNLLHPVPTAPTHPASRDGYHGPQYSVTTTSVELNKKSPSLQRPTTAPPPVPTSKPPVPNPPPEVPANKPAPPNPPPKVPANKPALPVPPKALKPPVKS